MKRWIIPLASLSAVAGAVVLALFLAGVFDNDEALGSRDTGADTEVAGVCAPDSPDCEDTLVSPDGAGDDDGGDTVAPGGEVGHVGVGADTPIPDGEAGDLIEGDGPATQPVCAPGFPDCVDMIVYPATDDELETDR